MKTIMWLIEPFLYLLLGILLASLPDLYRYVSDTDTARSEISQSSNDSIRTEIRRYKLDSLRLELAIIEADMRNDSIRNDIRHKVKQSKP